MRLPACTLDTHSQGHSSEREQLEKESEKRQFNGRHSIAIVRLTGKQHIEVAILGVETDSSAEKVKRRRISLGAQVKDSSFSSDQAHSAHL